MEDEFACFGWAYGGYSVWASVSVVDADGSDGGVDVDACGGAEHGVAYDYDDGAHEERHTESNNVTKRQD